MSDPAKVEPPKKVMDMGAMEMPMTFVNRTQAAVSTQGAVRISFAETFGKDGPSFYRTGVVMLLPDAYALYDLLGRVLPPRGVAKTEEPVKSEEPEKPEEKA